MMSALVCPGIGQFMQGRKAAGSLFLLLILAPFTAVMVFFIRIMISFYRLGFDMNSDPGDIKHQAAGLALSFGTAIAVYIIGIIDTVRASKTPPPVPAEHGASRRH